jgi:hypothetical protein
VREVEYFSSGPNARLGLVRLAGSATSVSLLTVRSVCYAGA